MSAYLMSPGDEDSTNYINASFIDVSGFFIEWYRIYKCTLQINVQQGLCAGMILQVRNLLECRRGVGTERSHMTYNSLQAVAQTIWGKGWGTFSKKDIPFK